VKIFVILLFILISLDAREYYSKTQPRELFEVKASVGGKVVYVDNLLEGKDSNDSLIVRIDDKIDIEDLKASKLKLQYLTNNIKFTEKSLANSKKVASIDSNNYEKVKNLASYSKVQKDAKLLSMIRSQNSLISIQSSLENLKTQKADLRLKIKILKDKIEKKNIKVGNGNFIYKIYPSVGDYLNPGSKLLDVYDVSSALLVVFVSLDELKELDTKTIYLDGKATDYKIHKKWRIADNINISSYRVEIIIDKPEQFSKLVKIEFK